MPNHNIYRPKDLAAELARTWETMNKAREALRLPSPDIFLGRRHYDLTPLPDFDRERSAGVRQRDRGPSAKYDDGCSGS